MDQRKLKVFNICDSSGACNNTGCGKGGESDELANIQDNNTELPLLKYIHNNKKSDVEQRNGKVTFGKSVQIPSPDFKAGSSGESEGPSEDDNDMEKLKVYVIIDVGGERFQANRDSFLKYPNTRLGRLMNSSSIEEILTLCEEYIPGNPPEYFFDKNPENFASVLEMYRSGDFHIPDGGRGKILI